MSSLPALLGITDQILLRLRSELLTGHFRAGAPLREVSLADRFGVSRASIRPALQQLVQEGLLIAKRNCGVTVAPAPSDAVRDLLMPMRVMLETYALRACFDQLEEADFERWLQLLGGLRQACQQGDVAAVIERDWDFHRSLLLRGGQANLLPLWQMLITQTRPYYRHAETRRPELLAIHEVHEALVETFRQGDVDTAVEALSQHIWDGEFNQRIKRKFRAARGKHKEARP
jgi:GntR family transcriptional regulator, rspAB operon transcriptional repressor